MGETGKRSRQDRDGRNEGSNQKKRAANKESSGEGDLVAYRILCPNDIIGSVIGRSGKVINALRQETHARIKVVDPFPGADKRVITIHCYVKDKDINDVDEDDLQPICPAQDALLKVHSTIVNVLANVDDSDRRHREEAYLLVPASQAAAVIGKSGATIKRVRSKTGANIKISPKDPGDITHSCAMSFDNFLQITGDAEAVNQALYAVSAIMYKFSPKEEISLDTSVPEFPPIIIPSNIPIYPAGSFFSGADTILPSSRTVSAAVGVTPQVSDLHGYADTSAWASALPVASGYSGQSRSEELVVRVLCPSDKIGRVIGKGGSTIKNIRQSSGARIEVDDTKHDTEECIITITSTESTEDFKSAAVEAVLLLQNKINDEVDESVNMRLLVSSKVIGCLIGKNGAIINEMRKKADIRISKGAKPKRATANDELVEVSGEVINLRDVLLQIILRLREDALKDRDGGRSNPPPGDSMYSSSLVVPPVLPAVPPLASIGYDQKVDAERGGLGTFIGSSLYGYSSLQAGDNGYGSISSYSSKGYVKAGDNGYGSLSLYSSKGYGGLALYNEVVIPANALTKVMGKGGANIDNIRKISGARVEIVESKTSRSERIALISGTTEQKRAAENMIQLFIMST